MDERKSGAAGAAIEADVKLTPAHSGGLASVQPVGAVVTLPLVPGTHVVTTPARAAGQVQGFANPELMATLTIWYDYDPEARMVTLCAPDLVSDDSTFLSTFPRGSDQVGRQYSYSDQPAAAPGAANWNYTSSLTPNLAGALHESVRSAQQAIIDAAMASGLNVALRTPVPLLTAEEEAGLRVVYQNGIFKKAYNPAVPLEIGETVFSIMSVWGGTVKFNYAEAFANVIGSTGDPKIGGNSWIGLWRNQFGTPPQCTSLSFPKGFGCTGVGPNSPLGGHIIQGKTAKIVPYGVNYVYILPICSAHNNDNSIFMEALQTPDGIWLKNYHQ